MNKKLFTSIFIFVMIYFVAACSPIDNEYNPRTENEDLVNIEEMGIPQSDLILLKGYIATQKMNNIYIDTTLSYDEILENARSEKMQLEMEWYKNNLARKILEEKNQKMLDSLNTFFSMTLLDKYVDTDPYKDFINVVLNIENKGKVEIRGLIGVMSFYDIFGDLIKKAELKCDDSIPPQQAIQFSSRIIFNSLLESDMILMEKDKSKIIFKFEPTTVLLASGQIISLN